MRLVGTPLIIVGFSNFFWGTKVNAQHSNGLIRFDNLRQQSTETIGEFAEVKAKAVPFVSSNAKGVLRSVQSMEEITMFAKTDAAQIRRWTSAAQ